MIGRTCAIAGSVLIACGTAVAEPTSDAPMSGPRVEAESAHPTLVGWTYKGELVELETSPELAAIELLDLDARQSARVHAVVAEYKGVWERIVYNRIDEFDRIGAMIDSPNPLDKLAGINLALRVLKPVERFGPLQQRLADALPRAQRRVFNRLVDEYRDAHLLAARRKAHAEDWELNITEYRVEQRLGMLWRELDAAINRTFVEEEREFDEILKRIDLDPDTEGRVRRLIVNFYEHFDETETEPTELEETLLWVRVMGTMTPEQGVRAARVFREHGG